MQGLPRINMISLDLKESNETPDLSPLYNHIESHYNESSENYKEAFKELINLRQISISGTENLNCLTNMKRYYCQLQLLKARFPLTPSDSCAVSWSWEDSNSNTTVSLNDISYEETSILYNIGCLHCNLGSKESRVDLESTKVACTHFQCSAWAFQTILEKYAPLSVTDLECDLLRFLNLLMLAEAHECVLEKSMVDQRRSGITAKIAFQISDFYKQCQGLLKSENIGYAINSRHYKTWKKLCILKEYLYLCLSCYYMALVAEEANKYGDIVAWMKLAKDKLDKCTKPLKELKSNVADETIQFVQDVINGKLESSVKDNNFVYYDKVPEPDMLPPIKGAMLLKGIAFDVNDPEISGKDIFRNLIPMETHFSSSVYSEKKAEILRNVQADIEEKNEELQKFLNDIQWNNESLSLVDSKAPQELFSCAAFISANPEILTTIKNTMKDISSISIEVEESLQILSDKMRNVKIDKNLDSWKSLEQDYSEFVNNFEDAKESNSHLRDAFACTLSDFTQIKEPMETVIDSFPSVKKFEENEDTKKLITESKRLLNKVEEMKTQRFELLQQLKTQLMNDDLTQHLLSSKSEIDRNKIIEDGLKKHDELIDYLRQNMSAQANIMDAIVEHNVKIADTKLQILDVKNEREKIVARIVRSFNLYKSIIKKGEEGIDFYRKLSARLLKFQTYVDQFIPQQPPVSEPEIKPLALPIPKESMDKQNEFNEIINPLKSETETISFNTINAPQSIPNQPLRLKDYLKDRKSNQIHRRSHEIPQQINSFQKPISQPNVNPYQYTPWGFYGPPSGQTEYTPNYSVSKCKVQDSEFRTTQNVYLPTPASEIGTDHSVYLNYSSLPRTNYSSYSGTYSSPISSAASIGNLASNIGFTIPYQHNSVNNPNVISMAHGFGQIVPISQSKSTSNDFDRYQYCSYPYTHEIKDSHYFSQFQHSYSDSGYANNMQHVNQQFSPYQQVPQSSQPDFQYSGTSNIPSSQSVGETKYQNNQAFYASNYQQDTPQQFQQNQYPDSRNMNIQPNSSQYSDSRNTNIQPNSSQYSDSRNMNIQPNSSQYPDSRNMNIQPNSSQYSDSRNTNIQPNSSQYSDSRNMNIQSNSSQYSDSRNVNIQPNSSQYSDSRNVNIQSNSSQYSDSRNVNIQPNSSQYSEFYMNSNMSGYQQNQCPVSSVSNKYGNVTGSFVNQENYHQSKHFDVASQNLDNQKTFSSKHNSPLPKPAADKQEFSSSSTSNKTTNNFQNINNTTAHSKLDKKSNTRDLLSSSPTNAFKQDNSIAVLEPKILTKQEIEDQNEEKRKQIYHKQHSGLKHPLNDHLILNRFIADAERFLKKITELLDSNNNLILDQHWNQLMDKERSLPKKSTAVAKCSPMKNRMQESVPYDENRVIIKDGKDDYINASHILLQNINECFPRFITCQSPLPNTVSEFWTAIFEQGCEILVQLVSSCGSDDMSKGRVVTYWPDPKSKNLSVGSKFEISVQSFKEKSSWNERILLIKHLRTNQSRSVWHFQVNNVSNKLPKSLDEFLAFEIELCRYYRQQRSLTKPIGVSCINGSSVSGVFIILTAALMQMEITGIFPDIDNILLTMWPQRKGLLDDKHQLTFVYKSISKAASDMLTKRNIVIGPGRISSSAHSNTGDHSPHSTSIMSTNQITATTSTTNSIIDSIFTNQHLQLSDLDSVLSKWTVKAEESPLDQQKQNINKSENSNQNNVIVEKEMTNSRNKATKSIQLPSKLIHLQDPSSIDFTPTPSDKRKMTKKEFEAKLNNTYVQPASNNVECFDPLKALDPIHQLQ